MLALCACGGAGVGGTTARGAAVDPAAFLMEVGAESTDLLRRPARSIDELDAARREARGAERRQAVRELVVAYLFAAEDAEGREAARARRRAEQLVSAITRGSRDRTLNAEMAFAQLWMSGRADAGSAEARATRFTERLQDSGHLLTLAWMIRGEIALEHERFEDAIASFRFALGQLEHPLYAYALVRTAQAERRLGRADDADQALSEAEQLGCREGASPLFVRLASAAAAERGTGMRRDPDGVTRPASCPAPGERSGDESEDEAWHPAE